MQRITSLTSYPNQQMQLVLDNNETADFNLYYNGRVQGWFFNLEYKDLIIKGTKVVLHPNILRQFRNNIPFGIRFEAKSKVEPFQDTSFSSGDCIMYILNSDEVQETEEKIYNS